MVGLGIALVAAVLAQQPPAGAPSVENPALQAGLGACSADFVITDGEGHPVAAAIIRTRVRYGPMSVKRMDLEIGTDSDGKARIEGLPAKARPVVYDINKAGRVGSATQSLADQCHGHFDVAIK
jgi:hypothetical protein